MESLAAISLVNIDTHVGNFTHNLERVKHFAEIASDRENATIAVFPEQVFSGYPSEDLVHYETYINEQLKSLVDFTEFTGGSHTIYIVGVTIPVGGHRYNCAAVVQDGIIHGLVPKEKLPTYGIFHEWRTTTPGYEGLYDDIDLSSHHKRVPFGDLIFEFKDFTLAANICEDDWSGESPIYRRAKRADIVANISASPFREGVVQTRREMLSTRSGDNNCVVAYANQVGGQDSLVFDGGGFVLQNGRLILEGERWREGIQTCVIDMQITRTMRSKNTTWRTDVSQPIDVSYHVVNAKKVTLRSPYAELELPKLDQRPFLPSRKAVMDPEVVSFEDLLSAMKMGLKGYVEKNGFQRVGIALSGGNDSYLTLAAAWLYAKDRFGDDEDQIRDFIYCYSMPSIYNSDKTKGIAFEACQELGVTYRERPIQEAFELRVRSVEETTGTKPSSFDQQNIQARIRGSFMWDFAAVDHFLWLHTGNLTENAVGYTTMGGDIMGGFSLIGDLPKSVILRLLAYLATKYSWNSLRELLQTKASAELAANQEDERELGPFVVNDFMLDLVADKCFGPVKIYSYLRGSFSDVELLSLAPWYETGDLKKWFKRFYTKFYASEFKRMQMPQAIHLGRVDLDRDRALHLPVVMSPDWYRREMEEVDKLPD